MILNSRCICGLPQIDWALSRAMSLRLPWVELKVVLLLFKIERNPQRRPRNSTAPTEASITLRAQGQNADDESFDLVKAVPNNAKAVMSIKRPTTGCTVIHSINRSISILGLLISLERICKVHIA